MGYCLLAMATGGSVLAHASRLDLACATRRRRRSRSSPSTPCLACVTHLRLLAPDIINRGRPRPLDFEGWESHEYA